MRHQGHVIEWNDRRGSGFIAPSGGGAKVFLHVSALPRRTMRPRLGALLSYELGADTTGRPRAADAQFMSPRDVLPRSGARHWAVVAALAAAAALAAYAAWFRAGA